MNTTCHMSGLRMNRLGIFLSVVLVVHNQATELPERLREIADLLSPKVDDYEIIIVDNASQDDSISVLRHLSGENGLPNLQVFCLLNEVDEDIGFWVGILWIFASLIPGTVIRGQILEWRMLYYALAGLAVVIGGITWGGLVLSQNMPSWVRRTFLALPLSTAILATITMLGYAEVYRLRSQLDQQQITELVSVVTPQSLTSDTTFIPINPAIKITKNDPSVITVHDRVLFGVFEIHWAGKSALRRHIGDQISIFL
jgi:hypothetical protein